MAMELSIVILDAYIMHHFNANELLYTFVFYICDFDKHAPCVLRQKGQKSQNNYILVTFDLDMNDDISITIDRIIMYCISNKMTRCQLISKKDRMSIVSFV